MRSELSRAVVMGQVAGDEVRVVGYGMDQQKQSQKQTQSQMQKQTKRHRTVSRSKSKQTSIPTLIPSPNPKRRSGGLRRPPDLVVFPFGVRISVGCPTRPRLHYIPPFYFVVDVQRSRPSPDREARSSPLVRVCLCSWADPTAPGKCPEPERRMKRKKYLRHHLRHHQHTRRSDVDEVHVVCQSQKILPRPHLHPHQHLSQPTGKATATSPASYPPHFPSFHATDLALYVSH